MERNLEVIANRRSSVEKLLKKVGPKARIRAVYEAGPTGYSLYWELSYFGVACQVAAPHPEEVWRSSEDGPSRRAEVGSVSPKHDLSYVWIPDESHEALRELVRAREAAKRDEILGSG